MSNTVTVKALTTVERKPENEYLVHKPDSIFEVFEHELPFLLKNNAVVVVTEAALSVAENFFSHHEDNQPASTPDVEPIQSQEALPVDAVAPQPSLPVETPLLPVTENQVDSIDVNTEDSTNKKNKKTASQDDLVG